MWRKLYEVLSRLLALTQKVERHDKEILGLQQHKSGLEMDRTTALQQVGANHRSILAYDSQIKVVDAQLQELLQKKEQEVREYQINSAHTTFLNAMQSEMALKEHLLEVEAKLTHLISSAMPDIS